MAREPPEAVPVDLSKQTLGDDSLEFLVSVHSPDAEALESLDDVAPAGDVRMNEVDVGRHVPGATQEHVRGRGSDEFAGLGANDPRWSDFVTLSRRGLGSDRVRETNGGSGCFDCAVGDESF